MSRQPTSTIGNRHKGFTLLELLVVLAIIFALAALIAPSFNSIGQAGNLTRSASLVQDQLVLARQKALAQSRYVEVRLYSMEGKYRALRLMQFNDTSLAPLPMSKVIQLPENIVILPTDTYSTLVANTNPHPVGGGTEDLPTQSAVPYKSFTFTPSGGTNLPIDEKWFLTLVNENAPATDNGPADNFIAIQIDPTNGRVRSYQP